ncbi:hypothetical protein CDD82_2647 [Ophiocordyceps australis]|uniref:Multiple myeloma tumor-associated protein 2-like N-terminal domain-containing protein n=1 Tax=Ophiocordyceps australis TaxID=1399860 RepID=A0A2C5ZP29_9HYPO|nr:hypothetical protein CDD82_2647 [Ophiocordyceps australis]
MDLLASIRKTGSRGGVDFSWDQVANSAHRENYLGHSLKAPVGRWQQGRDLNWYAKSGSTAADDSAETDAERHERQRKEELRKVKEAEEDAMARALGLPPPQRNTTGANSVEIGEQRNAGTSQDGDADAKKDLAVTDSKQRNRDSGRREHRRHSSGDRSHWRHKRHVQPSRDVDGYRRDSGRDVHGHRRDSGRDADGRSRDSGRDGDGHKRDLGRNMDGHRRGPAHDGHYGRHDEQRHSRRERRSRSRSRSRHRRRERSRDGYRRRSRSREYYSGRGDGTR